MHSRANFWLLLLCLCSFTRTSEGQTLDQSVIDFVSTLESDLNVSIFYNSLVDSRIIDNSTLQVNASTVFAPTDDAFDKFPSKLSEPGWNLHLKNILSFHLAGDAVELSDLKNGSTITMLNGENVTIVHSDDGATSLLYPTIPLICNCTILPDSAPVVYVASNVTDNQTTLDGNLYQIDGVLEPSFLWTSVLTELARQFPTLLQLGGLVYPEGLDSNKSYTILAPTEEAFAALGNETLQRLQQPENIKELTQIMNNHFFESVLPSNIISYRKELTPVSGLVINVSDSQGVIKLNDVTVVQPDILASNGIVHGIDGVILSSNDQVPNGTSTGAPTPTPVNATKAPTPTPVNNGSSMASNHWQKSIYISTGFQIFIAVTFAAFS